MSLFNLSTLLSNYRAPRYDSETETEIYSLGGGMLVLNNNTIANTDNNPDIDDLTNLHRTATIKRRADRRFYPRVEGNYVKIERKGGSPSTYWWEVTDKMGNKSFYGGYDGSVVDNAVIKTAKGNIAHWALYRTEDTNGNYVQYYYTKGQGSNGYEFYPEHIEYTKHKTAETAKYYKVSFVLDSEITSPSSRTDIQTNARLGLVQSTSKLLSEIKIDLMDGSTAEPIRSYRFDYQNPNFSKEQLAKISEYDANDQLFYSNTMEYFNEVTDGSFMDTTENNDWDGYTDNIEGGLIPLSGNQFNNRGSFLGTTKSLGINGGASFNVGVGFNYFSKQNTVGVNLGYGYNESDGLISFVDMNGDGLPDKLFKRGSSVYYRPNKGEFVQSGQPRFGNPITINGLSNFSKNVSNSFSLGAEANFILFLGYTYTTSKSKQKIYLSDVNGDGLVDVARPNGVIFNSTIQENTDIRNFLISTESTPNYIPGGQVNSDIILDLGLETREELEAQNPLHDVLKRWVAPVSGTIQITGTAILTPVIMPDSGDEYYPDYDGVRVSIERHRGNPGELAYTRLQYSPQNLTFTNPNGNFNNSIAVEKGDRIYFRVHSRYEGSYDRVNWTPDIKYTMIGGGVDISLETSDANGFPYFSSSADEGFILSADGGVTLPTDATAVVEWDEMESQYSFPAYTYSDNLIYRVIIGNVNLETGEFIPLTTFTKNANQSSSNTITKSGFISGSTSLANYTIPSGRTVKFEVYSNSNVDWKKINWKPRVKMSIDGQTRTFNAVVNYGIYNKKVNTSNSTARKAVTANKPIQIMIERTNQAFLNDNLEVNDCKKITLVVKNNQKRVLLTKIFHAKVIPSLGNFKNLALYNNTSSCSGSIVSTMVNTITSTANITNPVFTEFYTDDWDLAQVGLFKATLMQQDINNQYTVSRGMSTEILAKNGNDQFGSGYRYWGQFGYNSTAANPTNPGVLIDEGKFDFDTGEIDPEDVPTEDPDCNCGNPGDEGYSDCMEACMDDYISGLDLSGMQNSVFVQFSPLHEKELIEDEWYADVWNGYDGKTYVGEDAFSSSRLGIKNINTIYVDPTTINGQFIPGITIVSHGDGDSVVGGVGPIGGSWSGSFNYTKNQFMDMNGDRYPDIVTENRIQFTSPLGNLDDVHDNLDFDRPTTSENNLLGSSVSGTFLFATNGNSGSPSVSLDMGGLSDIPITPKTAPQPNSSASFSGSSSEGSNDEYLLWVDMNGDGLPDRVYAEESPIRVSLNLGYGFADPQVWGNAPTSISGRTENFSSSAGGSFSIMNDSWGGGISVSASEAFTNENFVDLNGDGLPDRVRQDGGTIRYRLNTGTGFGSENTISNAMVQFNRSTSQGANASFTFGFGFFGLKATTSIKAAINDAVDRIENTISDINGDGYADILYTDSGTNDGSLSVRLNKTSKTHLLKRVNLPLGGHWEIDYEREQNSYEMPNAKWKMTSIEVHDGFTEDNEFTPDVSKTSVEYRNGRHDRREREFMGYGEVQVNQLDVKNGDAVYRYSLQEFHTNSYYLKGAVKKESLFDANDVLWTSTETTYAIMARGTTNPANVVKPSDYVFNSSDFGMEIDRASLFVSPVKTTKKFTEGGSGLKTTFTEIEAFDAYGNITQFKDNGEGGNDAVTSYMDYQISGYDAPYFKGYPLNIRVMAADGASRAREATYDFTGGTANLTSVTTNLTGSETATVSFDYDDYGNIEKVTHEESQDANGNPFFYEYTYDDQLHTYPVNITDAFGYSSNNTYDYRFGALVYTEDMNYMPMRTRIDDRGRVVEITGPYELFVEGLTTSDPAWTTDCELWI